jgi:hypothetical protein
MYIYIRLFADDCIIYRRIIDSNDIENMQTELNRLGEWAVENEMRINPGKSKVVSFNKARVKGKLRYCIGDQLIPQANNFKYLGIIIRSDLSWADHVNYTLRKSWRAHRVQKRAAKFANNTNESGWETLTQRRAIDRICALFKAYTGGRAWKTIGNRLLKPCYLGRDDHSRKIRIRKQRTDVGKYSFVNRTLKSWNKLPPSVLATFPCKLSTFKKRVKKVITS